jgi:hypothetical protein
MDACSREKGQSEYLYKQYPMTLDYHDGIPMMFPLPRPSPTMTIPLPRSHIPRTLSEVQLSEEMIEAELRELRMFYRVVNGIQTQQKRDSSVVVTPDGSRNEGSTSNINGWDSHFDDWSIAGFTDTIVEASLSQDVQEQQRQVPRRFIPYRSDVPALVARTVEIADEDKSPFPDDDDVFSLDL